MCSIVKRSCKILDIEIDEAGALEIAGRSRGTPRIANNLIQFVRDYAQQRHDGTVNKEVANGALELLEIDKNGLDEMDKRILRLIATHYKGGPVGISTLSVAVSEEAQTIEDVHEPYLIQEGYLQRTPQGRVLTSKAWQAVGLQASDPTGQQTGLGL